jgi:hypothetical protein
LFSIIQQSRLADGSRKITHITEVTGMQGEVISLQDIFVFRQEGLDKKRKIIGRYVPTGFIPKFVEELEAKGMKISRGLFNWLRARSAAAFRTTAYLKCVIAKCTVTPYRTTECGAAVAHLSAMTGVMLASARAISRPHFHCGISGRALG